ncbi:MAG: AAA family ATPase, partial [Anaerolineales bacterium]|nr:AAA family ATPase [Anaerolineales bacterium]
LFLNEDPVHFCLNYNTLTSWSSGIVKKPRVWQDVVKLAKVLHLGKYELNELLAKAGYPALDQLEAQAQSEAEAQMLAFWHKGALSSDKPAPFQTIPDLPTFVGREMALRTLEEWLLANAHVKPIVLEGTAGVGKTVLAARLAYHMRTSFPDGVLWARLDTTTPMTILLQFAEAYGRDVTNYEDLESRSAILRELLAHKRALLVLDNVQNSRQIEPLLPPTGPCSVLITSRHRNLALVGSNQHIHLDAFTKTESMALFARILGEESIDNESAILATIADTVGHLPLALDIVACRLAYEPGWKTADFLTQLQRKTRLLDNLTQEQRCVRLSFTVSYDQLTSEQQRFFAALGAFGGEDFSVEAAAAVANMSVTT